MQNPKRSFPIPLLLVGAGLIILSLAAFVLLTGNSRLTPAVLPTSTIEASFPESAYPRIQIKDALAAFNAHSAIFVDVRTKDSFDKQHISGALSIPLNELSNRLSELPKGSWIITYCT